MTCIIGIVEKSKVYIGADSGESDQAVRKDKKVFKVGPYIIGGTTSFRMLNLLNHAFNPPVPTDNTDLHKFMCTEFIDALRKCFIDGAYMKVTESVQSGGQFLVGYRNRLFLIDSDFQVGEYARGFNSVGSGARNAIAVLTFLGQINTAKWRILQALKTCAKLDGVIKGPFLVLNT